MDVELDWFGQHLRPVGIQGRPAQRFQALVGGDFGVFPR